MALDPDDPRPPYLQVADALRAAILTHKLQAGDKLPSQAELAEHYGVARMTVQQALRILRTEGLTVSRQGSGIYVRERTQRPVELRPHIEAAFAQANVAIDFAGFSGETLHGAIQEPLDKIRNGTFRPTSIAVRVLLPDLSVPAAIPALVDSSDGDEKAVRLRSERIARRHAGAIIADVTELAELGLIEAATADVRVYHTAPQFKLYIINRSEVFFGFYPISTHTVKLDLKPTPIFDSLGKDAILFHYTAGDETYAGDQYIEQAEAWFESIWTTVSRTWTP